jgi:GTP-binding protein
MSALFDTVLAHVPAHDRRPGRAAAAADLGAGLLQLRRPHRRGPRQPGHDQTDDGRAGDGRPGRQGVKGRVNQVLTFQGLDRVQVTEAGPGDIVLINGIDDIGIGVTVTDPTEPGAAADAEGRRADADDELLRQHQPAGRPRRQVRHQPPDLGPPAEGTAVERRAARQETDEEGVFEVMGRGELHLTILVENMRREGYELAVSKPRVVFKTSNGERTSRSSW